MSTPTTTSKVDPSTLALSDKIAGDIALAPKTGVATVSEDVFYKHLPTGHTRESVDELVKYRDHFVHAVAHQVGHAGTAVMKSHSGVNAINVKVPMYDGAHIDVTLDRSKKYTTPARDGVPAGETTKYGVMDISVTDHATDATRGQLKKIRQEVNDGALAALGGKVTA